MSLHVKPAPGLVVRAPDGAVIPPEGAHLVDDLYLRRRIAAGDLVPAAEPPVGRVEAPAVDRAAPQQAATPSKGARA